MHQWFSAYLKWHFAFIAHPAYRNLLLRSSLSLIREKIPRHLSWPHKHDLSCKRRNSCTTTMPNLGMSASLYILLSSRTKVQEIMWLEIPIYCKQAATAVGTKHVWFDGAPWENQAPGLLKQLEILTFWSSYRADSVLAASLLPNVTDAPECSEGEGWAAPDSSRGWADFFC